MSTVKPLLLMFSCIIGILWFKKSLCCCWKAEPKDLLAPQLFMEREDSMILTRTRMIERMRVLETIINEKTKALMNPPDGNLIVSKHGKGFQYYVKTKTEKEEYKAKGKYIRKDQVDLAYKIAQRDYDRAVLEAAEREWKWIRKWLKDISGSQAEDVFENIAPIRSHLITPIRPSLKEFQETWAAEPYAGMGFRDKETEYYTDTGIRVRSKSELMIGNGLTSNGIFYRYEYPLFLTGLGQVHPDFTVLNPLDLSIMFWEHFGMMDDPQYAEQAVSKINKYIMNGIYPGERLIVTFESSTKPLSSLLLDKVIKHYFFPE